MKKENLKYLTLTGHCKIKRGGGKYSIKLNEMFKMKQMKINPKYEFVNNQHLTEEQIKTELLIPTKFLFVN